jgi:peptide/nickel transport system substrate-binding protein
MSTKTLYLASFLFLLASCGGGSGSSKKAVGGKVYGGTFKFMSSEKVTSLLPISTVDVYAQRINGQIFETILRLDMETMKVAPGIAESYQLDKSAKVFTFKIRKGVFFHDDACFGGKGRELTAQDVKFTLDLACSGLRENKMGYLFADRIEGAKEYQAKSKKSLTKEGVSGIRVLDDATLEITLTQPFTGFDKILCHTNLGIMAVEAYEKYGRELSEHPVGTGPFMLDKKDDNGITLKRNPNYWGKDEFGNQLPFLDNIEMSYVKDKRSELLAFRKKEIDIVLEIPVDEIDNILGSLKEAQAGMNVKHRVESIPSMSMNYVAFANQCKEFSDVRVRQAFAMAVDRSLIVNDLLMGEGWAAEHGFVPSIENYHSDNVVGQKINIDKARALLTEAGFKDGKDFPSIDFYVNAVEGSSVHKMCQGVVAQIKKNLNVDVNIKLCTYEERNKAIIAGKAKMWRSGWIADYPDAENFLSLFYSKNIKESGAEVNAFRFKDSKYDQLFELALRETNEAKRNDLFALCDQIIVDKAPVMPILTDDFMVMINARVRDFKINSMESLDFSTIFIKEPKN